MPDSGIPRKIMLSIVEIYGRALSMIMSEVVREDYAQYSASNPGFLECARSFKKATKQTHIQLLKIVLSDQISRNLIFSRIQPLWLHLYHKSGMLL